MRCRGVFNFLMKEVNLVRIIGLSPSFPLSRCERGKIIQDVIVNSFIIAFIFSIILN
jgi:hypothetical protein